MSELIAKAEKNAYAMGLKPDEFWVLTPREWLVWAEGYDKRQERSDLQIALICCTIARAHGVNATPEDFMPKPEQSPEDQLAYVRGLNAMLGGTDDLPKPDDPERGE